MLDKNGHALKVGQLVKIENAYFKNDNGLWIVTRTPETRSWCGKDVCLHKAKKDGSLSKTHSICFYPLCTFTNSRFVSEAAKRHNDKYATIEIIKQTHMKAFRTKQRLRKWQYKTAKGYKIERSFFIVWMGDNKYIVIKDGKEIRI